MDSFFSDPNLIAVFAAIGTAFLGVLTYWWRKRVDINLKKAEQKRSVVTDYLASLDSMVNHAAYSENAENYDEAAEVLKAKASLTKIYIYSPGNVVSDMDKLLTEATNLATIISKIPNSKIFDEDQFVLYKDASERTQKAYIKAINTARKEFGLHPEEVVDMQILILGARG